MRKPPKNQIAERFTDWNGRDVYLDKDTLRDHIQLFHVEELLVIQQLKAVFHYPLEVQENKAAGTEVAIYDIACNGQAHLVVAIEKRFPWKVRLINTLYACEIARLPKGKVIWKRP